MTPEARIGAVGTNTHKSTFPVAMSSAANAVLSSARENVPDDLVPYYRAAERTAAVDSGRAAKYLRVYLGQEAEGNQPSAREAARLCRRS